MEKQNGNINYDDERTNRLFSVFCYGVLFALSVGVMLGVLVTYFILKLIL
jgi:hypothetical protein